MISKEEYLTKILQEIETAKINNRKGIFKINEKIPDAIARYVNAYLLANTKYRVEFKKCNSCKKNTWDIMVIF